LDNLIAICVSCHCDVHTNTKLTRRFTEKELKLHRDNVCQLVADGKLPSGGDVDDTLASVSASTVRILVGQFPVQQVDSPQLLPEAVEILLAAVAENTPINFVRFDGGMGVLVGGREFGDPLDLRSTAKYRHAVDQLRSNDLVDGDHELLYVTYRGFLVADDILSAGAQGQDSS
jgi:hypothetical protein